MPQYIDLYTKYTSTSALSGDLRSKADRAWTKKYIRKSLGHFLPIDKGASILEIGCGFGACLKSLAELGYSNCSGIDLSDEQIRYAIDVLKLNNVQKVDAIDFLKTKTNTFNCILALDFLEHFELPDLMVLGKTIVEALKPDGILIVQVPNGLSPMNPFIYGDLTHVRAFTVKSLQQFFLEINLQPTGFCETPVYVYNSTSFYRNLLWKALIKPILHFFAIVMNGTNGYTIYTANLIGTAKKLMKN